MRRRPLAVTGIVALMTMMGATVVPLAGQGPAKPAARTAAAAAFTPSKTPWGDPDLQGVFTNNDENGIPLERPDNVNASRLEDVTEEELARLRQERETRRVEVAPLLGVLPGSNPVHWFEHFGAANSRAWLVVDPPDGKIPALTPEAQRRPRTRGGSSFGNGPFNSVLDFSLYDRCISRGVPGSMMPGIYGNAYEIVQAPGYVTIMYEMIHEARVIPLDGRPSVSPSIRSYMGDARGRWEGNTLVVETTNFKEGTAYRGANADRLKLIERFTPVAANTLQWSVTLDDPTTWTRPWTFAMNLTRGGPEVRPFEYACHEGNYGMANMLRAARLEEQAK
jgi:hypothetical protein